jgi:hypothetical protein
MKKYAWIVALLLALTMAFIGCPNDGDDDDDDEEPINPPQYEWKTVWEMAEDEDIQAIIEGPLTFPAGDNLTDSPFYPLIRAGGNGDVTIEAEKVDGKTSFKFTTIATWGAGIDLRHSIFGFRVGDKITVTGELLSSGAAQLNFKVGTEDSHGNKVSAPGPINWEVTLTAALLAEIQGGNPAGLRIDGRQGSVIVRIDNIKIEGERPSEVVALPAPVITETTHGVAWGAIEGADGYIVYADGEELAELPSTATSINLNAQESLEVGTEYSITVVALGSAGSSLNSVPSNAILYTHKLPTIPTTYQVPEGGADFFYVNLNDWETESAIGITGVNTTVPAGVLAEDKITLTFTEKGQRVSFKLTDDDKAILNSATKIKVTIEGTSEPDTSSFRYHIGDPSATANWNATTGNGEGALSTILSNTLTLGSKTGNLLDFFILQFARNTDDPPETTVVISSIKIAFHEDLVDIAAIPGVTAPHTGGTPATPNINTTQYTGTVVWSGDLDSDDNFDANKVYTATITLTAKAGYTLTGVAEDFFTVAGATATTAAGSGVITAVFPATTIDPISILAIAGVTAPHTGVHPVTEITATQYTGTVAWKDSDGTALAATEPFAASTVYTATITLTAKTGFTLTGVEENTFTVAGATNVTHAAGSGVVTAVFPMTAAGLQPISGPIGVTAPVTGAIPVGTITASDQFTGTVTWKDAGGTALTGPFAAETVYTATIILEPKEGYTLTGVAANSFSVVGATSVTNFADTGTVTAVFPATEEEVVAIPSFTITGVGAIPFTSLVYDDEVFTVTGLSNGIQISGGNYDWAYVKIPITLPGGKKLSDFVSVTLNLTGISADTDNNRPTYYKDYHLKAGAPTLPGDQINPADKDDIAGTVSTGSVANDTAIPMIFGINPDKLATLNLANATTFEIAIWAPMNSTVVYKLTDIVFVEGVPLPSDVVELALPPSMDFGNAANGGWDVKSAVTTAGKMPTYLLLAVDTGGDGLGGTSAIINSSASNFQSTKSSKDWGFNGTWAASAKVFIIDLSQCTGYNSVTTTDSYIQIGLSFNTTATHKLTKDRLTGAAMVFDGAGAAKIAPLCIAGNVVDNDGTPVMWVVDQTSIGALFTP